jgi:hypothetical protein
VGRDSKSAIWKKFPVSATCLSRTKQPKDAIKTGPAHPAPVFFC